jgi:hypothetical protein
LRIGFLMTPIPTQRIYEGYLLSGDRRVFFVRHFGTFCNVGCSVGFHVDTKAVIFLARRQIRRYAKEQVGTSFLRWCLLRTCALHRVFVATQTAGAQIRTFEPCRPHIYSRLPLLSTAPSCHQRRCRSSLDGIIV